MRKFSLLIVFIAVLSWAPARAQTTDADVSLSASPTNGAAPLTVHFTGNSWTGHVFDPGDGTIQDYIDSGHVCTGGVGSACPQEKIQIKYSHTYNTPGTYAARLTTQKPDAPRDSEIATQVITVTP